jgi:dolichol-phosphate mannosyltransferase
MPSSKLLLFIPTHNEAENAQRLCRELSALRLGADILFCDDNSPDGTGEILDGLAREFSHVRVIHRSGKLGIGSAHQEGIRHAYAHGYDTLVTMDCDFTHQPADVQRLLTVAHSSGQPVCIASRYMKRDSLPGWNPMRRFLTSLGHFLTVNLLRLPQDATGALRAYQLGAIPRDLFDRVRACGYSFFFESLFVLHRNGFAIEEMPIALPARTYGSSKMSWRETVRSASRLLQLYWAGVRHPESFLLTAPLPPILGAELPLQDPQGWDPYWTQREKAARLFLNSKPVSPVVSDAISTISFTNISCLAHGSFTQAVVWGRWILSAKCASPPCFSSLNIATIIPPPSHPTATFSGRSARRRDGAYNLGVEHFPQDQIVQILREMGRTVKPGGKVVIFWPHRCATSVFVLRVIHWVLNLFRGKAEEAVRLHPPEISLLQSREQAREVVERAGFNLVEYYFGIRDLLVQAVVVGCKR